MNFTNFSKFVKIRKNSFLHISIKHKTITFLLHTTTVWGFIVTEFVSLKNLGLQANVGSADMTMLFYSVTNCISKFASKISVISICNFSRLRILFLKLISIFKIRKNS